MITPRTNKEALGLVAGFGLWSLAFVVLYGGHGLACGVGVRPGHYDDLTRAILTVTFAAFIAAHVGLAWWLWHRFRSAPEGPVRLVRLVSLVLALAALGATAWTLFPVTVLTICS